MRWLAALLKLRQFPPPNNEIRELTAQFYVTLEAYFAKVKSAGEPRCQKSYERIEQLLREERNWTNAYAIEQLLIHLFDDYRPLQHGKPHCVAEALRSTGSPRGIGRARWGDGEVRSTAEAG